MSELFSSAPAKPKELRPHQIEALRLIKLSAGKGNRRIVCQMPTGAGKTVTAAKLIASAMAKGNASIFTVPALSLINQTVDAFEAEGVTGIGVMQANHPRTDPKAMVQVASVQTLARRDIPDAAVVICDECFPAGTMVETVRGPVEISLMRSGDMVYNATGLGEVLAVSARPVKALVKVMFDDGTSIECTENHRLFTGRGWVEAGRLAGGEVIIGIEDMPGLWRGILPQAQGLRREGRDGRRGRMEQAVHLLEVLLEEADEPYVEIGGQRKVVCVAAEDGAQATLSRREWAATVSPTSGIARDVGRRVGDGSCGASVEGGEEDRDAGALQIGYSQQGIDDRNRGGWWKSLHDQKKGGRCKENRISGPRRVVSVAREEQNCARVVYNMHVSGHPSYFADGALVHNCHIRAEVVERLMDERPDVFFIGLSATPWADGMGERWQDLVIPVTIGDLIEQGMLSKFTAFAPDVPDLRGVKIKAGDYAEAGLERVMGDAKLIGSVTQTWLEKGEDRPTLCFGVNRAHAQAMAGEFQRHGVASAYVDAFTDMAERAFINDQFRRGDVRVICSVRTMTTGVDLPVSCIIDAAPTKSEILHVQKIGRGLRVNPGTEDCLILDHAGNSLRLGLVTDIFHDTLSVKDRAEKGEAKPAEEKLPKPCPACGVLHTGMTCPACGNERRPSGRVETAEGELVQLTGGVARATRDEKQAFWSMALWLDAERGRGGKMALGMFKGKFGVWPRSLDDTPSPPDRAFLNYDKSRRIAYAKAMAKRDAAA